MIEIIPSHESHAVLLAPRLIEKERICRLAPLWSSREVILMNMKMSCESWTAFLDGEAACIFGIWQPNLLERKAMPWMLSTDHIKNAKIAFFRMAKKWVKEKSQHYDFYGVVDKEFYKSKQWLGYVGFNLYGENFNACC